MLAKIGPSTTFMQKRGRIPETLIEIEPSTVTIKLAKIVIARYCKSIEEYIELCSILGLEHDM